MTREEFIDALNDINPMVVKKFIANTQERDKQFETPNMWDARDYLSKAFVWADSPQGHDYWNRIWNKLPK